MKLVKNLVFAVVLASVLAFKTPAGELGTAGSPAPVPDPSPRPEHAMMISNDGTVDPNESTEISDYLFFEALAALLSMY